jgi:superfamily II RNA helicase
LDLFFVAASSLDLSSIFPFELDGFQLQAIESLNASRSVVVCAPTGSGKTLVGEYAIYRALAQGKRVFYTTPLKALSNQKLRDFREQFGHENVGLLTGDTSINRDAPIVVMTTEIFRNMLYGTPIGEVGTSLEGLETVVLDECHYMNDRQRGTVWEESIIYCPRSVQIVALSATVANSEQLTDWINHVHGDTDLIYSDYRPVPLNFFFGNPNGLFPLLNDAKTALNPRLQPKPGTHRPRGASRRGMPRAEAAGLGFIIGKLRELDMLPAIYFIFSRRGCSKALEELKTLTLVNAYEAEKLEKAIAQFVRQNPDAAREEFIAPLRRGLACHHAGILPAWKMFIEELFQAGLIKVVFATETLAAGINMPARTTVISSLSKRTDVGHRLLTGSEFLQMAGRAGRRGMDTTGYVVTLQSPFEGAKESAHLATSGAEPLVSQFTPSYGMVLNLLQMHSLDEIKELIERSFGQYLSTFDLRPQREEIHRCQQELNALERQLEQVDWKLVKQYEKLTERLREEKRLLKTLQQQSADVDAGQMAIALSFAVAGTILIVRPAPQRGKDPMPVALVMKTPGSGKFPHLVCLGQDNRWYVMAVSDVIQMRPELPRIAAVDNLNPPLDLLPKPGQCRRGTEESAVVAARIPDAPPIEEIAPEVYAQQGRMLGVQAQLEGHPVHQWGDRTAIQKRQKRAETLSVQIKDRTKKLNQQTQRNWTEFLSLIDVLQAFGALDNLQPTALGEATAAVRGDNELWLGLAVMSGVFDDVDPHHLAAGLAGLVTEVSRPDLWCRYGISDTVSGVLEELRPLRRQLFQAQRRAQIDLPIWCEFELVGLVEQWALGTEWKELCESTSLDEGDVVRVLRRTLDFLAQLPHMPHLPQVVKTNAARAIQLIDRFPINETIA